MWTIPILLFGTRYGRPLRRHAAATLGVLVAVLTVSTFAWSGMAGPIGAPSIDRPHHDSAAPSPAATPVPKTARTIHDPAVKPCQALAMRSPCTVNPYGCGVHGCTTAGCQGTCRWESARSAQWQAFAQGEYVAHARTSHVSEYRLRVDDELDMVYRKTREVRPDAYRINSGDEIRIESMADATLDRSLIVLPDGMITVKLLGQIQAAGLTISQLRERLEEAYKEYYHIPEITVTPVRVDTKLDDLRDAVDRRQGLGGQSQIARVTPEGSISLPGIGWMYVQGLTLAELRVELAQRYEGVVSGMEVIPVLVSRAPRYAYVLGEVGAPGRIELAGPTTLLQAIAMAESWNNGAYLDQVVVFRRDESWQLTATAVSLRAALRGKSPCPEGEIWIADSDVIIVPKGPILEAADFIDLVFTRGIYGVLPFNSSLEFTSLSSL